MRPWVETLGKRGFIQDEVMRRNFRKHKCELKLEFNTVKDLNTGHVFFTEQALDDYLKIIEIMES